MLDWVLITPLAGNGRKLIAEEKLKSNWHYFEKVSKENLEEYLEPTQTPTMELFLRK